MNLAEITERIAAHAPYLARLAERCPDVIAIAGNRESARAYHQHILERAQAAGDAGSEAECMQMLRIAKGEASLLIAAADISGIWPLETVTQALSELADACVSGAIDFLLRQSQTRGEWEAIGNNLQAQSGIVVLGMGKLGGFELNYSSDIDLILLCDRARLRYTGNGHAQAWCTRLSHDLVRLLQERTKDGYVFRTDLRLRPDPASTPPMMSVAAAMTYYETVGQNWERAALIKARPVAGDIDAGECFLKDLAPFLWRRHLDFAAIEDIQSIRRQMMSRGLEANAPLPGHNIKLGAGGIREIEFYTQIHQLIWGGRTPSIRTRGTCETLNRLVEAGLVGAPARDELTTAYRLLRTLEHRLQMREDEQTHSMPSTAEEWEKFSAFCGYATGNALEQELRAQLTLVHAHYAGAFRGRQDLGGGGNAGGSLVFTGVGDDPETLETLRNMGFRSPETVSASIQAWHRGRKRATRTQRARELLTEVTPDLLRALASTAYPDVAFLKFDEFLSNLPAGVQLFALFRQNPALLVTLATVMGYAPALAENLSRHPALLDAALPRDFTTTLPSPAQLAGTLSTGFLRAPSLEEGLRILCAFKQERLFQAGVHLLEGRSQAEAIRLFLTDVAELVLQTLTPRLITHFAETHGEIAGGRFAILGLGRLGAREVSFGSDLDLMFLYDAPDGDAWSDGEKPLTPGVYYNRLAQRIIHTLSLLMPEGRLYEVDTRLRPAGADGPLAVQLSGFDKYLAENAWQVERIAFLKGRSVAGDTSLMQEMDATLKRNLSTAVAKEALIAEVATLRKRIHEAHPARNIWDVKYAEGGLMDLDLLAGLLTLSHTQTPAPGRHAGEAVRTLAAASALSEAQADTLFAAHRLMNDVLMLLRLCVDGKFDPATAPAGLSRLLSERFATPSLSALQEMLENTERSVYDALTYVLSSQEKAS